MCASPLSLQSRFNPLGLQWVVKDGCITAQRPFTLNADGNTKQAHIEPCGKSTSEAYEKGGLEAQLCIYFNQVCPGSAAPWLLLSASPPLAPACYPLHLLLCAASMHPALPCPFGSPPLAGLAMQ